MNFYGRHSPSGSSPEALCLPQLVDRKMDGFLTEFEDFAVYSPQQYEEYVDGYTEPTTTYSRGSSASNSTTTSTSSTSTSYSNSQSSTSSSTTTRTGSGYKDNGSKLIKYGIMFIIQHGLVKFTFNSFIIEAMPNTEATTAANQMIMTTIDFFAFISRVRRIPRG